MNAELREAVENGVGVVILKDIRTGTQTVHLTPGMWRDVQQALRDQEAEIAGYRTLIDLLRTDKSGTKRDYVESRAGTMVRITAHLGGENNG